jgi:hypothetical protein
MSSKSKPKRRGGQDTRRRQLNSNSIGVVPSRSFWGYKLKPLKPKSPSLKACLFLLNSMVFLFSSADNLLEVYRCLHRLYKWSIVLLIYRSDYKIAPHHIWDIAILPLLPCLPYSLFLSGKLNGLPLSLVVSLVMRGLMVGRQQGSALMSSLPILL